MQSIFVINPRKLQKTAQILTSLIGLVLLVSGFAKAADAAYFSNLLTFYGSDWFGWFAPLIIGSELIFGFMLLVQIRARLTAWLVTGFMAVLTLGYAYGLIFHGVYNCGCFGHLEALNLSPVLTFIRNILLCGMLVFIGIKGTNNPGNTVTRSFVCLGLMIGVFTIGFTFSKATVVQMGLRSLVPTLLAETAIPRYVDDLSPDSTYLVFAFSYSCPYCNQSVGNVALFQQTHTVDRVIGLVVDDSIAEQKFRAFYTEEPFPIRPLPVEAMKEITGDHLPTAFLIRHDTIFITSHSEMFSPRFVKDFNKRKQP